MSLRMSWEDLWTFINPQDSGFLSQLDNIISSSTLEHVQIILKNAPQTIKDRYNETKPLSELDRQRLYASLGINDASLQKYKRKKHINSLFSWIR